MWTFRWIMGLLVFACALPFILSMGAQLIATVAGCELDLASVHPCVVAGRDIGHALLVIGMMGYGLFFTFPVLIVLVPVWILVELVCWVRGRSAAA